MVENFRPPAHAIKPSKGQSFWGSLRDDIITFAYGHERPLLEPHHIVEDSRGRLIITDPAASAIHVLDGRQSFRISAGRDKRLQLANGLAVDAEDNIYAADPEQGLVLVFDRNGNFVRYIGQLGSHETLFHFPTGIAIDRHTGYLYVLDSERHLLFILDLQGREIKRVGRYQGNDTIVDFEFPSEIAVGPRELAIMDDGGSRIWITDLTGEPLANFRIGGRVRPGIVDDLGLAVDTGDDIYVSGGRDANVRVYDRTGRMISSFGSWGVRPGEFQHPVGVWVDAQNRIFVADKVERRVQVFQLTPVRETQQAGLP